jgi:YesN/AraC family two-component response regulator
MKILDFTISDFGSLQKELNRNFDFSENSYNYFQPKENNSESFFKRIFLESGLEVWILSAQFSEDILLKQSSSNNLFNAIHFLDFNGQFYHSEISKKEESAKGIYITSSELNLNFKIKAYENINIVSFIYSKRWSDINLFNTSHYKTLFDSAYSLKKYALQDTFKNAILKLLAITQSNKSNGFSLKINTLALLSNFLDFVENESPIDKIDKLDIANFVLKIEEILSTDFEIPINKINTEIAENGFNMKEFIEVFKEKNNVSLFEFRRLKRIRRAVKLLEDGFEITDAARKIGFKTDSKFIEYFKKEYGYTPYKYIKSLKTTIPH